MSYEFTVKNAEIGQRLYPKRGRKVQPLTIRQLHRKDGRADVEYQDGTKGAVSFADLRKDWTLAAPKAAKTGDGPAALKAAFALPAKKAKAPAKKKAPGAKIAALAGRQPRERCKRGHDMTDPANQIVWKSAGNAVRCRACYALKRAEQKARRDAKKAAAA